MKTITIGDISIARLVDIEGRSTTRPSCSPMRCRRPWRRIAATSRRASTTSLPSAWSRARRGSSSKPRTCIGNDKSREGHPNVHMRKTDWLAQLAAGGAAPEEVDFVLCTHLHVDHVGWNTRLVEGRWVPTFPNAKYLIARTEFDHARIEARERPEADLGGFADSVLPVVEAGQAVMIDTDYAMDDTLWLEPTPGHTPGHVCIRVASRGAAAVISGDVVHHPVQYAEPDWNSGFCIDAEEARSTRRAFLDRYAETGTRVLPAHFATPTVGTIERAGDAWGFAD